MLRSLTCEWKQLKPVEVKIFNRRFFQGRNYVQLQSTVLCNQQSEQTSHKMRVFLLSTQLRTSVSLPIDKTFDPVNCSTSRYSLNIFSFQIRPNVFIEPKVYANIYK